jgi:hypothetical protein
VPQLLLEPALQLIGAFSRAATLHYTHRQAEGGAACIGRVAGTLSTPVAVDSSARTVGVCRFGAKLSSAVLWHFLRPRSASTCVPLLYTTPTHTHTQSATSQASVLNRYKSLIRFRVQLGFVCQIDPSISDTEDYCRLCFPPGKYSKHSQIVFNSSVSAFCMRKRKKNVFILELLGMERAMLRGIFFFFFARFVRFLLLCRAFRVQP